MKTKWVSIAETNEYPYDEYRLVWFYNENEPTELYLGYYNYECKDNEYWSIVSSASFDVDSHCYIAETYKNYDIIPTHWCYAYIPEIKDAE